MAFSDKEKQLSSETEDQVRMAEILSALKFFVTGAFLGLTAGISPGPLLTLVISETLKHNRKEGIKIAVSPLFTDIPIVLASVFLFSGLSQFDQVLGIVSFLGAIFIAYLGYETLSVRELSIGQPGMFADSLKKGIVANLLSLHPYLFWITVGAPLAIKALETSVLSLAAYFLAFYLFLIGSKIGIAHVVAKSKVFFNNMLYLWTMRFLGIALFLFSVFFFLEGLKYFGFVGK